MVLWENGIQLPRKDGMSLWIPMPSEQFALVTLAVRGIRVLPGERCSLGGTPHIRVATGLLRKEQIDFISKSLIIAIKGT